MKTLILATALVVATTFSFAQQPKTEVSNGMELKKKDIEVAILKKSDDQVNLLMEKPTGKVVKIKIYEDDKINL